MSILYIFGLYLYVSLCVVAFDFFSVFHRWWQSRALPRREHQVREALRAQYPLLEKGKRQDAKQMQALFASLRHLDNLSAFDCILEIERTTPFFKPLMQTNLSLLHELVLHYKRRPPEEQAFLSHILSKLRLAGSNRHMLAPLAREQVACTRSESVYLSENAFKAVVSFGVAEHVADALLVLNKMPDRLREKLLTDDLLAFPGNQEELAVLLWTHFPQFCASLQIVLVNYLRLLPPHAIDQRRFFRAIFSFVKNDNISKEVQLAAIRYFQKYPYAKMLSVLLHYVSADLSSLNWEFAAVSATALSAYPCQQTRTALLQAVKSPNWYLRYNAAESLIRLGVDTQEVVAHLADRYAKEMVQFRLQIHDLKQRKGTV